MKNESTQSESIQPKPTYLAFSAVVSLYLFLASAILLAHESGFTLGWVFVVLFFVSNAIFKMGLLFWNEDLAWRRMDVVDGKGWDWLLVVPMVTCMVVQLFVAVEEFDYPIRNLQSPMVTPVIGLLIYVSGWALFTCASFTNPYFETMVRIQTEVGHAVVDQGLYSIVRHPGYVGFIAIFLATPLMLASQSILLLSLVGAIVFVVRTVLEDRTLQAELPGYAEYSRQVRFRLIPGVW